jgi:hypothetical protein
MAGPSGKKNQHLLEAETVCSMDACGLGHSSSKIGMKTVSNHARKLNINGYIKQKLLHDFQ